MSILKYLAFVKTVDYGSFTKAAQALHYSQSGISRMIHDLEEEWNVTLLSRSRAGITLTSEGAAILPAARRLCGEYESLETTVKNLHGIKTGVIRIGSFASVAEQWLPNIIKAFQKDYPGIDYELLIGDYREIAEWIKSGRVDCGFLIDDFVRSFSYKEMAADPLLAIVPETHPLAALDAIPLHKLCEEPFLLVERDGESEVLDLFASRDLSPHIHFATWDDYAIMSLVEAGLGVSLLFDLVLRRSPHHIAVRKLDVSASRKIFFATKKNAPLSPAVKRFLSYLSYR